MSSKEPTIGTRHGAAFTLVELLVVIAIVSLLLSMLTPAVRRVREMAYKVKCTANLNEMNRGWQMYLNQNNHRIPFTRRTYHDPNWSKALNTIYPDAPEIYDTNEVTWTTCPVVQVNFEPMFYFAEYGYVINTWWSSDPKEYNDRKKALNIRSPSDYPWFMDPKVYEWGSGYMGAHRSPWPMQGQPGWGVGFHHDDGGTANTAFADGSVRSTTPNKVNRGANASSDIFPWFENN